MDVLGDLLDPDASRTAIECPGHPSREIDLARFTRTAWKTANFFRHLGAGSGTTIVIVDQLDPEALYAFFGAGLLGATVRFGSPSDGWRVLVGPTGEVEGVESPPGSTRIAYGDPLSDPAVAHFGTDVWSENPAFPRVKVDPDDVLLRAGERSYTHGKLLDSATDVVERFGVTDGDCVSVRESLSLPGTLVAGVLAPLLAGATVVLPGAEGRGTIAIASGRVPESRTIDPRDLP